jgi:hypothetical protein
MSIIRIEKIKFRTQELDLVPAGVNKMEGAISILRCFLFWSKL